MAVYFLRGSWLQPDFIHALSARILPNLTIPPATSLCSARVSRVPRTSGFGSRGHRRISDASEKSAIDRGNCPLDGSIARSIEFQLSRAQGDPVDAKPRLVKTPFPSSDIFLLFVLLLLLLQYYFLLLAIIESLSSNSFPPTRLFRYSLYLTRSSRRIGYRSRACGHQNPKLR